MVLSPFMSTGNVNNLAPFISTGNVNNLAPFVSTENKNNLKIRNHGPIQLLYASVGHSCMRNVDLDYMTHMNVAILSTDHCTRHTCPVKLSPLGDRVTHINKR